MHKIADLFKSLPKQVVYTAYYLAADGGTTRGLYDEKFRKVIGLTYSDFSTYTKRLNRANITTTQGWYPSFEVMRSEYRIAVIEHLLINAPAFMAKIEKVFETNDSVLDFLAIIRYALTGKNPPSHGEVGGDVLGMLQSYYKEPWITRALAYVSSESHSSFIDNIFYKKTIDGELISREVVERLCDATDREPLIAEEILGLKNYYLFIAYGDYNITKVPTTRSPWTITTAAIKAVLEERYEEAVSMFAAALKIQNRNTKIKNLYVDLFPMYYYVMALYHLDNETTATKFTQILKKKEINEYVSLYPSRFLILTFLNGQQPPKDYYLNNLISATFGPSLALNVRYFGRLFDRYFLTDLDKSKISVPEYAIMRHELRDYINIDDAERETLTKLYGDAPALTSIYRKKDWELLIDEVMKVANIKSDLLNAPAPAPTSRIIYLLSGNHIEPKCQTVLKSGGWSKPKNVSLERFIKCEVEQMDDTDRQIAERMRPTAYSYSYERNDDPAHIFPLLIDSDRLYTLGTNGKLTPIKVQKEKPYIKVDKSPNQKGFRVTSNVTREALNHIVNGCITVRSSGDTYSVIAIEEGQRKIYEKLLAAPYFPVEAKTLLQKFLTYLDNVIEVKSSLIEESEVPTADGSDHLALKITPNAGMQYSVGVFAKPVDSAAAYCVPGVGRRVIYVENEGQSLRIKRDIKGEEEAVKEIIDVIATDDSPIGDDDYQLTLDAEQLLALLDHVRQNPEKVSVEWPQGKAVVLRRPLSQGSWNVGLKAKNGWFDIEGEVKIDGGKVIKMSELLEIVASQKGRFIRLGENDFAEIDKKLRRQLERIESLAVKSRGHSQISALNAPLLDNSVLDGAIKIQYDDTLTEMQRRITESGNYTPNTPKTLNATLRPYQTEGFQWMARLAQWGAGACLADDMGLGKTIQTIAFLLHKAKEGPALIVAPASVVPNWRNELERFAPSLQVTVLNKADDRAKAVKGASKSDVILSTYGLLSNQEESLIKKKWTTVCLDEAHTIKNRDTKMSKAAMMLQAKYRIALTGTPLQNHLGELWNLFNFINPGLLGSVESFKYKYVNPILQDNDKERRRALQRIIKPFMLRRTKAEVIDELPDKTDILLPVELSEAEMAMYEAIRIKAVEALSEAKNLDVNTLAEITKLRRAACTPELIDNDWTGASTKVQTFMELVRDFKGDNNRMLVFSQFTSFLDIVRKALDEAGEKYLYLDGSTPMSQREKLVEEFQQGDCPIFLISLKAGGLGLNLTAANYVVHLDPWWNPAIEQQATDRTYRIGQKRNVTVYHLIARNTIEEKIRRLHQTKRDLADSLLEGSDMAAKLTVKDVLEMVNGE